MAEDMDPESFAAGLVPVAGAESIGRLPPDTQGVLLRRADEETVRALVARLPRLRHLVTDGNSHGLTDRALVPLSGLRELESLDLECSSVTDAGLPLLAALPSLRWLDLGFAPAVTAAGIRTLRASRPDLEIEE